MDALTIFKVCGFIFTSIFYVWVIANVISLSHDFLGNWIRQKRNARLDRLSIQAWKNQINKDKEK